MNGTRTARLTGVVATTVALLLVPLTGIAHADITGTSGADTLRGSDGVNNMYGLGGGDTIAAYGGADLLDGGDGDDVLKGGEGPDVLKGGTGADKEYGGRGDDDMNGGDWSDTLYGGPGHDTIDGGDGHDSIYVRDAEDYDGTGDVNGDTARGGNGDDRIYARDGERDTVTCGTGTDIAFLDFADTLTDGSCETAYRDVPAALQDSGAAVAQAARDWALSQVGVHETTEDHGTLIDLWEQRTNSSGVPWCGIFAHEAYFQAGLNLDDAIRLTDWLYDQADNDLGNFQDVKLSSLRRGDLIVIDRPGGDTTDHIAIVSDTYIGDGYVRTVSGNWSDAVTAANFPVSEVAIAVRVHA
jgi:Ca2+-binding RTX toxin-like protein